jgi:hypothetical protein
LIRHKSENFRVCYQVNDHVLMEFLQKSQKSLDFWIVPLLRQLNPYDWIEENEEKKPGKGRPNKVYSLKVGFKDIITHLEKEQKIEIDDGMASIKRLKELVRD